MTARPDIAMARLRQVRAAAEAGKPISADIAAWLAEALERYEREAPEGLDLDRAFGLIPDPGNAAWWTAEALRRRDEKIRDLYERHYGDMKLAAAAREIARMACDYQASAWRIDQRQSGSAIADERKALVAEAFRTGQPFPGERQIVTILRNETSVFIS